MTVDSFSGFKHWRSHLFMVLADLRLAIVLLLAIAVFSISGTVIEQGQSVAFYQTNYPEDPALFGFLSWKVLLAIGLDRVYQTWWFLALLILFGISLASCTFRRQIPALKSAKLWKFYDRPGQFQKLSLSTALEGEELGHLATALTQKRYRVYQADNALYARKGIAGRIGPIVVHASMILILLGSIWGSLTGFTAQELVPSGQTFKIQNIYQAGPWAGAQIPKDWAVKVNRFWIDYTESGDIDQFRSDLSVLNNQEEEVDRQQIYVNKPLKHNGVTLYQTDWGISSVKVRVNNSPVFQLPMGVLRSQEKARIWGTWVPIKPDMSAGISVLARDLQGTVLVYDTKGQLVGSLRTGMSMEVEGVQLHLDEVIGSTGLQIKADPGTPFVYAGFAGLMLGVMMSYISHSQVWGLLEEGKLYVGGRTNRSLILFEREFIDVIERLPSFETVQPNPAKKQTLSSPSS